MFTIYRGAFLITWSRFQNRKVVGRANVTFLISGWPLTTTWSQVCIASAMPAVYPYRRRSASWKAM